MTISIIIPAYNAAETLASTLHSVLAQSHEDWEAIVVDDGSQDDTGKIAEAFAERDRRIRVVSRTNGGEAAARNTGIDAARYDWLLFLDSDDWILPCHLARMTNELLSNPALDAIHCGWARVAVDGTLIPNEFQPPEGDLFDTLARRSAFAVHACVVRRSLVEAVGKFDMSLHTCPDWDLWQRIARTGARFGAVPDVLALYRMRARSASMDAYQMSRDILRVLRQGHAPDRRVPDPHPDHVNGLPPDLVRTQEYYLLSWCAGLLLGGGEDARPLLEIVKDDDYPGLHPDAIAQCIFEGGTLSLGQPPRAWDQLWPRNHMMVKAFFEALEAQSQAGGLASRALACLKQLIRKHSKSLGVFIEDYEADIAAQTRRIVELEQALATLADEHARESEQALATLAEEHAQEREQALATLADEHAQEREQALATLADEHAQEREMLLAQQQRVTEVESALGDLKTRFQELEHRHSELAAERSEWKRKAEEHAASLNGLSNRRWVRLGRRMGLL